MLAAAKSPNFASPALHGLIKGLVAVWPLWLLIGVIALAKLAYHLYRRRRLTQSSISEIDQMDGKTFEQYLATMFRRLGYRVENTRYRGDYGADLVVVKDDFKTAVQAKRWNKRVGVKAVQEAVASKGYYNCHRALVVANRDFTRQACVLARANDVELWDRDTLVSKLLAVRAETAPIAPAVAANVTLTPTRAEVTPASTNAAPDHAHCVTCGIPVSDKVRDYCLERPQHFGGRVYCFTHQRAVPAPVTPGGS